LPRLGSVLSSSPTQDSPRPPAFSHGTRRVAKGVLLAAIVAGSMAFTSHAISQNAGDTSADALATVLPDATGDAARGFLVEGSRSQVREGLAPTGVVVRVDGERVTLVTGAETVADALADAGVELGPDDEVSVPLAAPLPDSGEIVVSRVTYREVTERADVPFRTVEQPDTGLAAGQRVVTQAGRAGGTTVVYRVRLVDGVEASREETLRTQTAAVDEVVRVGSEPRSIARAQVAARGWGSEQFACLDRLWTKESNWNPSAHNASSGAYGIPQALPGSKMGSVAADWRTNPATQITWGLNYIAGRYGTPCAAWAHSQAVNWY
jgi:hypothetical protein